MFYSILLTLLACTLACSFVSSDENNSPNFQPIKIAAFNVKKFGNTYMDKFKVVETLVKIFKRYDIVFLQETRDSRHIALNRLKKNLTAETGETWRYISSGRLGRSRYYKEQYVFFYKPHSVRLMGYHQVDDSLNDVYAREPFAVDFEYPSIYHKSLQRVIFLGIHVKPRDAVKELENLPKTITSVAEIYPKATGIVTMGDFNADCRYVNRGELRDLQIFNSQEFRSLIPDDADTTVSENTDCAYDRLVLYGEGLKVNQSGVFNFKDHFNMKQAAAYRVSDHFPVEFSLL